MRLPSCNFLRNNRELFCGGFCVKYAWERQPMKASDLMDGGFDSVVSTYQSCRGWFTEGDRESKLTIRFQITENSTQLNENDKISTRKKEANECIRKRTEKKRSHIWISN